MSGTSFEAAFSAYFARHANVVETSARELLHSFGNMLEDVVARMKLGGKLILFGNGGSAADAQHIATELTVRFTHNRQAIPALALTTDTSTLTAIGNDLGFSHLFSRQIEALGNPNDIALGLSTSGSSENVVCAMQAAYERGLLCIALTGKNGGKLARMKELAHVMKVSADETAHIQEVHIMLGHLLCLGIEKGLNLES